MLRRPSRLSPSSFRQRVNSRPHALVRVSRDGRMAFPPGLIEYYDDEYPRAFFYGVLNRSSAPHVAWFREEFRTAHGPVKWSQNGVDDGYYLFRDGLVIGHHPGSATRLGQEALDELVDFVLGRAGIPPDERVEAIRLITWFNKILRGEDHRSQPPPPREPEPEPEVAYDPFEILGIASSATDEEIRAAYRLSMKLNHPDRVAHLSPAIQAFAEQKTLEIQRAYEAIQSRRRR